MKLRKSSPRLWPYLGGAVVVGAEGINPVALMSIIGLVVVVGGWLMWVLNVNPGTMGKNAATPVPAVAIPTIAHEVGPVVSAGGVEEHGLTSVRDMLAPRAAAPAAAPAVVHRWASFDAFASAFDVQKWQYDRIYTNRGCIPNPMLVSCELDIEYEPNWAGAQRSWQDGAYARDAIQAGGGAVTREAIP